MKPVRWIIGIIIAIPCVLIALAISQFFVALFADSFVKGFNEGGDGTITTTSSSFLSITSWVFLLGYGLIAFLIVRRIATPKPSPIMSPSSSSEAPPAPQAILTGIHTGQRSSGFVWTIGAIIAIPCVLIASVITSGIVGSIIHAIIVGILDSSNGPVSAGANAILSAARFVDNSIMLISLIGYGLLAWIIVRRKAKAKPSNGHTAPKL